MWTGLHVCFFFTPPWGHLPVASLQVEIQKALSTVWDHQGCYLTLNAQNIVFICKRSTPPILHVKVRSLIKGSTIQPVTTVV